MAITQRKVTEEILVWIWILPSAFHQFLIEYQDRKCFQNLSPFPKLLGLIFYRGMVPLYMFPWSHLAWSLGIHKAVGLSMFNQFCCNLPSSSKVYLHHSSGCFSWKLGRHGTHTVHAPHHHRSSRFSFPLRCCIVFSVSLLCRRMDALLCVTSTHASRSPVPAVLTQVLAEVGF